MRVLTLGLAFGLLAGGASAQLPTQRVLPLAVALAIAQGAQESCAASGYRTTTHVLDRTGRTIVVLRGDGANPHTFENSRRKAYTSVTLRVASAEVARRLANPATVQTTTAQLTLPGMIALAGALPIMAGDELVGGVGVSGAPGGERDEVCAKAGIDRATDQLR